MRPYIYYLPILVFVIAAVVSGGIIDVRDARLVTRPGGVWSLPRLFRKEEWTPAGLAARRRVLRGMTIAVGLGIVSWILVLTIAGGH